MICALRAGREKSTTNTSTNLMARLGCDIAVLAENLGIFEGNAR